MRFRAADRTLTVAETTAARNAAVAEAAARFGATIREVNSLSAAGSPVRAPGQTTKSD